MTNWKTTALGVITLLIAVLSAVKAVIDNDPTTVPDWGALVAAATAGFGLIAAKDHNITGGTKSFADGSPVPVQPPPPKA